MRKHTNDHILLSKGFVNTAQIAFAQRWFELLHYRSLPTYAVKLLNAASSLCELADVLEAIVDDKLYESNLAHVWDEARYKILTYLEHDPDHGAFLSARKLLTPSHASLKEEDLAPVCREFRSLYEFAVKDHIRHLLQNLERSFDSNNQQSAVFFAEELASELVWRGFNRDELYYQSTILFDRRGYRGFDDRWERFRRHCLSDGMLLTVAIPLAQVPQKLVRRTIENAPFDIVKRSVLERQEDVNLETLSGNDGYFAVVQNYWRDAGNAAEDAFSQIAEHFETIGAFGNDMPVMRRTRVGVIKDGDIRFLIPERREPLPSDKVVDQIHHVLRVSSKLPNDDRLGKALHYYRLSMATHLPVARFINAWIGFESFLRIDLSAIQCVRKYAPAILTRNYIYRLLNNFLYDCKRCGVEPTEIFRYPHPERSQEAVYELLGRIQSEDVADIRSACKTNTALSMRLENLLNSMSSGEDIADLLRQHHRNLDWHLQRLYRIRNMITHFGEVYSQISTCVVHLQNYLHDILLQISYIMEDIDLYDPETVIVLLHRDYCSTVDELQGTDSPVEPARILRGRFFAG